MKVFNLFVAIIGLSIIGSSVAIAEESTRIAFINTARVIEQAPQAAVVRNMLQTEFGPREAKLVEEQNSIKSLEERLIKDGALMSATEKRKLERSLKSKQLSFQGARESFTEDLTVRRNEELQKMQQEIAAVVVEVAKAANFDMVLEAGVVYANQKVNITLQVIEALIKSTTPPVE
ncbi:MAG: OmpH family outer membrane protein [Gammaproteobacteria bacterium]|nr:OmpH family outer membrane protein [Gammaproteobacteria bacterium]